jgi:hypothetical protein
MLWVGCILCNKPLSASAVYPKVVYEMFIQLYRFRYHHQPINVSTAGAQAFLMDYKGGLGLKKIYLRRRDINGLMMMMMMIHKTRYI